MKYERKSFSVSGPLNVTDEEWNRIFKGEPTPAPEPTVDEMMREELRYLVTLAEARATEAEAECAELRAKLLLAEMQVEALTNSLQRQVR